MALKLTRDEINGAKINAENVTRISEKFLFFGQN